MPIEFENTGAGATDISGAPDQVRTPGKVASDRRKQQNQNERRPGKGNQQQQNPLQQAASAVGSAAQDVGNANQAAGDWLGRQGLAKPSQSLNPVDWAKEYAQDAGAVWGFSRHA